MQALSIIDCPAESHLLAVLVKVNKMLPKRPSHVYLETDVSLVEANMVYGSKITMMMMSFPKKDTSFILVSSIKSKTNKNNNSFSNIIV